MADSERKLFGTDGIRGVARMVPAGRFLTETDAPYLAPVPYRGRRNEPAYVAEVVTKLADIRGAPVADVAVQVTGNFQTLFSDGISWLASV